MRENDKRTLREVHQSEPNPYHDRQNFEPEPAGPDAEEELSRLDRETDTTGADAGFDDGEIDLGEADPDFDTQAANDRSRSDIEEYERRDTASARGDEDEPRNSDDDDPWGDGIHDTPLTKRYEDMADRDELARRMEDLVADAYDWLGRAEDEDAQEIYDTLVDLSERLGNPPEATIRTEGGELPQDRNTGGDV